MNTEIVTTNRQLMAYGFSGTAINKDYCGTAIRLMDKMSPVIKANGLKSKGQNIWVYERNEYVFAGVELEGNPLTTVLEQKIISLAKYAYYKHIGPYNLIKQAGQNMNAEIKKQGYEPTLPYLEIYGHWNSDETKLETELLISLS